MFKDTGWKVAYTYKYDQIIDDIPIYALKRPIWEDVMTSEPKLRVSGNFAATLQRPENRDGCISLIVRRPFDRYPI